MAAAHRDKLMDSILSRIPLFADLPATAAAVARNAMLLFACVAAYSCSGSSTGPSPLPAGAWGGDHVLMTVAATGTHLEFDCAHGEIPSAIDVDRHGEFAVAGTYVREHGGPVRQGEIPDTHPAMYSAVIVSTTMTLMFRLIDTNESIGPFALTAGLSGRVFKCL